MFAKDTWGYCWFQWSKKAPKTKAEVYKIHWTACFVECLECRISPYWSSTNKPMQSETV